MRVTNVLEVGTLGGYSAIWMASMNPQLTVTTVECNERHAEIARTNIERAGLADRIELIEGLGVDVLAHLSKEVQAGSRPRFGFVFIDADKANNWRYFQLSIDMIISNSVICVDNAVRNGQLADWSDSDPSVLGSREVVEKAGREPGVDSVLLQTVGEKGYDGWLWAVVS
jgi:predicted O-methyltransferase YrrM